jgi:Polysaccharide lyase
MLRPAVLILLAALVATPVSRTSGTARTSCALSLTKLRAPGCPVLKRDTASRRNPVPLWGSIDCARRSRVQRVALAGGRRTRGNGRPHAVRAYRQLTVFDGDNFYGERCELGRNSWVEPTFQNYREGQHRVTFVSLRLPRSFPLGIARWQTVVQMKQAEPSGPTSGGPALEVQAYAGRFFLVHDWHNLWSTRAVKRRWIRLALDVRYSQSARSGSVTMYVDRNGDGDAADRGERSPTFHVSTLKREPAGETLYGLAPGRSIPSHLRVGIYHDPSYPCPRPVGCSIQVGEVEVVGAP